MSFISRVTARVIEDGPLSKGRLVAALGVLLACLSALAGLAYLLVWQTVTGSLALQVIGLVFLGSVQLAALGVIGEYLGAMQNRPYERHGF